MAKNIYTFARMYPPKEQKTASWFLETSSIIAQVFGAHSQLGETFWDWKDTEIPLPPLAHFPVSIELVGDKRAKRGEALGVKGSPGF